MDGDSLLSLIQALDDARASLDPMSEARQILDGVLFDILNEDLGDSLGYEIVELDEGMPDGTDLRGVVFDSPADAAAYLDTIPVGGVIVLLGDDFWGVAVQSTSDGIELG